MPTVVRIADEIGADDPRLAPFDGARDADLRGASALHLVESPRVVERYLAAGGVPPLYSPPDHPLISLWSSSTFTLFSLYSHSP